MFRASWLQPDLCAQLAAEYESRPFDQLRTGPLRSVFTLREMYDIILYILDKGGNHV
jgi:hypothetical protein